ncbi:MAG: hypothetical protein ACRD20_08350 [Terriglobales bacterium]
MNHKELMLDGSITEISRPGLYVDQQERVTVLVNDAEPLYAELRLPNKHGWTVGDQVVISIVRSGQRRMIEKA